MEFIEYTIGELALEIKTGKTPPTSNPEYFNGEIPWIGPSDLKGQKLAEDSERKISEIALEDNKAFLFKSGTVIISTIGDIGKTAIVKNPVATNQQLTGILMNDKIILPELFYYWIRLNKRILENKANTAVIAMLNNKLLKRIKVVFPKNIEDQYKIVGRLNRIQDLIDKRVETIELLDKYIQSVFLEMFGDPNQNPFKWEKTNLASLCNRITDGTHKTPTYKPTGIPFITATNVSDNHIEWNNTKFISKEEHEQLLSRGIPEPGDLLLTKSGTLGRVAVLKKKLKFSFYESVALIQPKKKMIDSYFLVCLLQTEAMRFVLKRAEKGVAVKHLHLNMLRELLIIVPPIHNQNRFSGKSEKIEALKTFLDDSLNKLMILFQTILQDAFSKKSEIEEVEVFESLLKTFTKEDLKQGDRLKYLLKWINCNEPRFSEFGTYDLAWDRLRELLEDGSIHQVLEKKELKLKVVK